MRRILGATALAAVLAAPAFGPALAQDMMFPQVDLGGGEAYLASRLIGQRVYATDAEVDVALGVAAGANADWDDIGEINDLVMGADGQVDAVILGVGGFLGLGERDVAVSLGALSIVPEVDNPGEAFLVVNTTKEALEAAPEFDRALAVGAPMMRDVGAGAVTGTVAGTMAATGEAVEGAAQTTGEVVVTTGEAVGDAAQATGAVIVEGAQAAGEVVAEGAEATLAEAQPRVTTQTVTVETTPATGAVVADGAAAPMMAGERMMLRTPMVERAGYTTVAMDELTADDIEGMRVYALGDEDVGEIGELIMSADGAMVERAVIDVGGFLGLGEKRVAVTMNELQFVRGEDGMTRAYIDATEDELEAQPDYAG